MISSRAALRTSVTQAIDLVGIELRPETGDAAYRALALVADRLYQAGDPRAAFPEIYGVITREVAAELRSPACGFLEPAAISELMGRFATRYLQTLAWSLAGEPQDCGAWGTAYAYAARAATVPIQDVILGLSAHINYDLAVGICETLVHHDLHRDAASMARFKHDHDYVNVLLRKSVPECFERVASRYGCRVSSALWNGARPVTFRVVMAVLGVWREKIWADVVALTASGADPAARRAVLARMDRRSTLIARALVAPSLGWLGGRVLVPRRIAAVLRSSLRAPLDPATHASL